MSNCIICNSKTKNEYWFCKECYNNIQEIKNEIIINYEDEIEIRNHYFNLNNYILNNINIDNDYNILKLYALTEISHEYFFDEFLINKIDNDINNILTKMEQYDSYTNKPIYPKLNEIPISKNHSNNFNDIDFRNKWPREHQCEDGHYVRSLSEMIIDNWLYNHNYVHAYEKSVYMESNPDSIVLSDFYLPQGNVYIEFWGIEDDEKYEARKNEKIKLYNKNNINRIDLNESHIKRLNDILPREIGKYIKKN